MTSRARARLEGEVIEKEQQLYDVKRQLSNTSAENKRLTEELRQTKVSHEIPSWVEKGKSGFE